MTSPFDRRREVPLNCEFTRLQLFSYNCSNEYDDDNNNYDDLISAQINDNNICHPMQGIFCKSSLTVGVIILQSFIALRWPMAKEAAS